MEAPPTYNDERASDARYLFDHKLSSKGFHQRDHEQLFVSHAYLDIDFHRELLTKKSRLKRGHN